MPNIQPLCPELAKIAELELGECPDRIESDLNHLKDWMNKQQHINGRQDDQFLIAFLRGCKYSLERTKEKLDSYYTVRTTVPEFFANRDPQDAQIQAVINMGITLPLPYTETPDSPRIFLFKMNNHDSTKSTVADLMKVSYMITDILLWEDPNSSVVGHTVLVDLEGLTFSYLLQFQAILLKKVSTSIQEAYPIRQKGIHFINPPSTFETLYKLFRNFLDTKLQNRMFLHESFEALHKMIPKRLLPFEYGGEAGDLANITSYWNNILQKKRNWFLEEENYKTDERKRIGKPKHDSESFGTDGSFRSLQVD